METRLYKKILLHCMTFKEINVYKFQLREEMLSLDLNGCQCQTRKSSKGRHFILYRQDGLPLYNTESGLELLVPQEHQGPWMEIFDSVTGMKKSESVDQLEDIKNSPPDLPPRSSSRPNSLTHDKSKLLSDMIKSYMKITHKTLLDITPKYIIMSLVQAVSYFFRVLFDFHLCN